MTQATLKIAGDSDKAQAAIVALEKKLDKLQGKLKQVHRQKPVKPSSLSSLKNYAGGFLGVAAAIDVASKAFMHFENIKKESAQKQRPAAAKLAALGQVADKNESLHDLISQSRKAFGEGSFADVGEAADLIRALKSASIPKGKERQLFIDMAANDIVDDAGVFAAASNALQSAVGKKETGNFAAITSKAFAASADSPSTAVELLKASTDSGGATSRIGLSDEELLAAVAVTATSAGGAAKGGTQMKNLLATLDKKGDFKGQSLMDSLQQIQGLGLEGAELSKFFGTTEALAGYDTLLKNAEKYEKILKSIHKAEKDSLVRKMISLPGAIPEIAAARAVQAQENQLENSRLTQGTLRNLRDAAVAELAQSAEESYGSIGSGYVNTANFVAKLNPFRTDRGFLEDSSVQASIGRSDPELHRQINEALSQKTLQVLERVNQNLDDINKKTPRPGHRQLRRNER